MFEQWFYLKSILLRMLIKNIFIYKAGVLVFLLPKKENGDGGIGLYIYPWIGGDIAECEFQGFSQYVLASYLFGSMLQGRMNDSNGSAIPIMSIKHDIEFQGTNKLVGIEYDEKQNGLYEEAWFYELEHRIFPFIKQFAKAGSASKLLYHLSDDTDILFGVGLFIRVRIELESFD